MNAALIYEPVQKDLLLVEEQLQAIACVDYPLLAELLSHVLNSGGKRVRPALTLLVAKFHEYNLDSLVPIATAIETLHTATLVHDDMIDNSPVRRGKPTLNSAWSRGSAVLAGDFLFAKAADFAAVTANVRVIRLFAQTLMVICSGELRQMFGAYNWEQSKADYFKKIESKTASLLATATESGAILSKAPESAIAAFKAYGSSLGMSFQIVDDILDFVGDQRELGKPVGSDLMQGTITLPALLLAERYPADFDLRCLFDNGSHQEAAKRAVEMIRNSPVIDECYAVARDYAEAAKAALASLPPSPHSDPLVALADYVVERKL